VAYDARLAARIRRILAKRGSWTEKEMFGGLSFLRDGKMFVGIVGESLMARVGKSAHGAWLVRTGARPMDFTGRPMDGYLFVDPEGLGAGALREWVDVCWEHVSATQVGRQKKSRG